MSPARLPYFVGGQAVAAIARWPGLRVTKRSSQRLHAFDGDLS
jgi:hypothetical protein